MELILSHRELQQITEKTEQNKIIHNRTLLDYNAQETAQQQARTSTILPAPAVKGDCAHTTIEKVKRGNEMMSSTLPFLFHIYYSLISSFHPFSIHI